MKKLVVVLALIGATVTLFLQMADKPHPRIVLPGNSDKKAIDFRPDTYQCAQCKMPLKTRTYAAEAVMPDGKTWFFDDVGCLALWLADKPFASQTVLWVYSGDTGRWIDARAAWYTQMENTPMGYGFAAYEKRLPHTVNFDTVCRKMEAGENLTDRAYAARLAKELER